jgi:hypothetical protein
MAKGAETVVEVAECLTKSWALKLRTFLCTVFGDPPPPLSLSLCKCAPWNNDDWKQGTQCTMYYYVTLARSRNHCCHSWINICKTECTFTFCFYAFCWPCISSQILVNKQPDALFHVFIYLSIPSLYMFRTSQCSSSGDRIVLIHHLVWLVCVSDCLVCRFWQAYQAAAYTEPGKPEMTI